MSYRVYDPQRVYRRRRAPKAWQRALYLAWVFTVLAAVMATASWVVR